MSKDMDVDEMLEKFRKKLTLSINTKSLPKKTSFKTAVRNSPSSSEKSSLSFSISSPENSPPPPPPPLSPDNSSLHIWRGKMRKQKHQPSNSLEIDDLISVDILNHDTSTKKDRKILYSPMKENARSVQKLVNDMHAGRDLPQVNNNAAKNIREVGKKIGHDLNGIMNSFGEKNSTSPDYFDAALEGTSELRLPATTKNIVDELDSSFSNMNRRRKNDESEDKSTNDTNHLDQNEKAYNIYDADLKFLQENSVRNSTELEEALFRLDCKLEESREKYEIYKARAGTMPFDYCNQEHVSSPSIASNNFGNNSYSDLKRLTAITRDKMNRIEELARISSEDFDTFPQNSYLKYAPNIVDDQKQKILIEDKNLPCLTELRQVNSKINNILNITMLTLRHNLNIDEKERKEKVINKQKEEKKKEKAGKKADKRKAKEKREQLLEELAKKRAINGGLCLKDVQFGSLLDFDDSEFDNSFGQSSAHFTHPFPFHDQLNDISFDQSEAMRRFDWLVQQNSSKGIPAPFMKSSTKPPGSIYENKNSYLSIPKQNKIDTPQSRPKKSIFDEIHNFKTERIEKQKWLDFYTSCQ